MPMSEYEQALVFAAKNGNEKSFEELYKIYYQKVYSLARATLKNDADAEDILQQTFIQAWRNISRLEDNAAFNTWIQRITLNQCYSLMRKSKPDLSIDDENDEHGVLELESELILPEVYAQREDLKIRLGRIIAGLSEVQRQTVQLFYFDNMSVEEIARIMDCSVGTVKSRLFLARKAIRTEIEETERKSGQKFYGVIGIPVLAFSKIFSVQAEAAALPPANAVHMFERISADIFGVAKRVTIEAAKPALNNSAKTGTRSTNRKAANAAHSNNINGVSNRTPVKRAATHARKKVLSAGIKAIVKPIVAAAVSAGILCGSVTGTVANAGSSVVLPDDAEKAKIVQTTETENVSDYSAAYSAYIEILKNERENILGYTWQKGHYGNEAYTDENTPRPICFADISGDATPELIYVASNPGYGSTTNIHVFSIIENSPTEIFNGEWDYVAGGGFYYRLFIMEGEKNLYAWTSCGDESWTNDIYRFDENASGKLEKEVVLREYSHPDYNGDYSKKVYEYYHQDDPISDSEYSELCLELKETASGVIMESYIPDRLNDVFDLDMPTAEMTYDEAVAYLKSLLETEDDLSVTDEEVFSLVDGLKFIFCSGVGAWGTCLQVSKDGSFVGEYHDTNMGETGEGYPNGTCYIRNFHGTFMNAKKIDEYTYSFELDELILDDPFEDYIEDGILYIAESAYGIEGGKTFMLYLPDSVVHELPESFVNWVSMAHGWSSSNTTTLPCYGIYNVEKECGFSAYIDNSVYIETAASDNEVRTIKVKFTNDVYVDLNWGWNLFNKDASEYDHNLAMTGLVLSQAAESGQNAIERRYTTLGFEHTTSLFYADPGEINYPGVTFASQKIKLNSKDTVIISVTVRGTANNSDILTDIGSVTDGFRTSEMNLKAELKKYINNINDSDWYGCKTTDSDVDVVFFITGHSLGGAVAELLASSSEIYTSRGKVFAYTFASPNVDTRNDDTGAYNNIHNIINSQDLVPAVPMGYKKYGHCWYYDTQDDGMTEYLQKVYSSKDWWNYQAAFRKITNVLPDIEKGITGLTAQHLCQTYLACMLKGLPSNMGEGAKTKYSLSSIRCPVDIQVLDTNGNIAACTVGTQVFYADGANLLVLTDGDEKYVYIPDGIEYNITFTGTGSGTMSYTQQSISGDAVVSEKTFDNVQIEPDKLLYANVEPETASSQKLLVIDAEGKIKKKVSQTGNESIAVFNITWLGWLFLGIDVISFFVLIFNIASIVKTVKKRICD